MLIPIILLVIRVIEILVLIRIILSWVMPSRNEFTDLVYKVTEPLLKPFRFNIPIGGMYMDLSPIVLFFVLSLLKRLVFYIF